MTTVYEFLEAFKYEKFKLVVDGKEVLERGECISWSELKYEDRPYILDLLKKTVIYVDMYFDTIYCGDHFMYNIKISRGK